jgi:hypothetical protein
LGFAGNFGAGVRKSGVMLYTEKYPVGTDIRIVDLEKLQAFKRDWKYHHPLSDQQMLLAG